MISFNEAAKMLGNRDSKKIAYKTYLLKTKFNDVVKIRLYDTDILYITKCESSGGDIYGLYHDKYPTRLTKDRLSKYSPVSVYQKKYVWYTKHGRFLDGQMFNSHGEFVGGRK